MGTTSMSTNERFSLLAEVAPIQRAAPLRERRKSFNDGPLFSLDLRNQTQTIVDEVVHKLGLDWRVQELQQDSHSRAGSRPPSRAGSRPHSRAGSMPPSQAGSRPQSRAGSRANSMSRFGSDSDMPGLERAHSWGNLSNANSVGNHSQRSNYSRRSNNRNNGYQQEGSMRPQVDWNQRLQMRNAWLRGRRRGRGGNNNHGRMNRGNRGNNRWGRAWGQWGQRQWGQWGRQGLWRHQGQHRGRQGQHGWGRVRRWGLANRPPLTPRGRAGQEIPQASNQRRGASNRGRGRGGHLPNGISHNAMPQLKTLEQLDKELDEYMASAPASLDKELEEYMAQNGLSMDTD